MNRLIQEKGGIVYDRIGIGKTTVSFTGFSKRIF